MFAVDMLARGASPYDVAKFLGDTIETVEMHCAEFVRELRERVRRMMESNEAGLEAFLETGEASKLQQSFGVPSIQARLIASSHAGRFHY